MPHLRIEYSRGLEGRADIPALCRTLHRAMNEAGIFPQAGIRIRAYAADHAIVADGLPENDFAALTLIVGAGRSKDALARAGQQIMAAAEAALARPLATPHFALSLEIRVADPDLSWKNTPIHARLSGKG
ncbi:5-carboxymethyl-2-hydroxymuconate isomerase [Paracoccus aerodenitrificans]|uniref:5-carboxymethyl-2-hydroxymuconate isomerase n=1 Tax=Paracoccus aerodenitrificans TaxID=3017781 RepID=UPI0022F0000F|nr:5-carboxymethyl-2-hydroxymuconate isomerase [Paracoccus aerodenitrificans]WBU63579.1 5-carboxymethyl-2-hydroxymuconate isomerase [Paracoccus aerodenitrificans]